MDNRVDLVTKLEFCDPTGSAKDRSALWILEQAIRRGDITPGATVVESSSGNFAISLASYCRTLGTPFVPVIDPNCNRSTEDYLRTLCDRVEKVAERDGTGGYLNTRLARVRELLIELDHTYWPNQYANTDAMDAHYRFTGGELCRVLTRLDYLFVGVGTAGTLSGLSRRIKERFPRCTVVAVDSVGSAVFGQPPAPRLIPGIGSSIVPPLCARAFVDDVVIVSEARTIKACHELFARHGLFAGGSTGIVYSAIQTYFAGHITQTRPVVAFLSADRGQAYADYLTPDQRRFFVDTMITALRAFVANDYSTWQRILEIEGVQDADRMINEVREDGARLNLVRDFGGLHNLLTDMDLLDQVQFNWAA